MVALAMIMHSRQQAAWVRAASNCGDVPAAAFMTACALPIMHFTLCRVRLAQVRLSVLCVSLLLQFLFRDPAWSSWATLHCLPFKATIGFSNMRGPTGKWALSGHPVVRIHNGVQPNAFGCFMSLFSYCDSLTFTHTCYASKTMRPEVRF